jgi:hypothetical protein
MAALAEGDQLEEIGLSQFLGLNDPAQRVALPRRPIGRPF